MKVARGRAGVEIVEAAIAGNRLKAVLRARRLSQEQAARRVGISYRHFNRIVMGASAPSLLVAVQISAVLETPIERLFRMRLVTRATRR